MGSPPPPPSNRSEDGTVAARREHEGGSGWSQGAYEKELRTWARAQMREQLKDAATDEPAKKKSKLTTPSWLDGRYNDADGFDPSSVADAAADSAAADANPTPWRWCASAQPGEGIGGYPCGLWVLFHTLLANVDRHHAGQALELVHE